MIISEVEKWLLAAMGAVGRALSPCDGTVQVAI
jgi:hypothetical protein